MKKKIAHITFDMRIGGAEQVIYQLAQNTDSAKFEVSIICLNQPVGPFGKMLDDKGFKIIAFDRKPGFDFRLIREIRDYIRKEKIDILHCHQYSPYIYGLFSSVFTKTKIIFTEHGRFYPDIRKLKRIIINPLLSMMTDEIIAISEATRQSLKTFENFPIDRIKVVYNGIDDIDELNNGQDIRSSFGIPDQAIVLGTVARLDPIKNHPMMINALNKLLQTRSNLYLVIVGDGPERQNLEKLSKQLGVERNVVFTGFRQDTHLLYKQLFDVFLLTSFSEGTAMTLLEAMASSLPCIVTNVGGNPEIVMDGETGIVIDSNDVQNLVNQINNLLENPNTMSDMGDKARLRFKEKFIVNKMVNSYQLVYEEL